MNIASQTLEKMEAATAPRPDRRKPWQFSILALVVLTMTSSLALVVSKPYWPVLKESLWPKPKEPVAPILVAPGCTEKPGPNLPTKFVCGPCGQG